MPLSHEPSSLTVDDVLPYLWELERRMAAGNSVYLYSKDIHGRAAVMAGCLLGRLATTSMIPMVVVVVVVGYVITSSCSHYRDLKTVYTISTP